MRSSIISLRRPHLACWPRGTFDDRAIKAVEARLKGSALDPEKQKKNAEDVAKAAQRSYEKQARDAERTYDRIADYAGDRIADLFLDTEGGWEKTMENVKRTAIATFARIAAEAALRPIVMPLITDVTGAATAATGGGGASVLGTASTASSAYNAVSGGTASTIAAGSGWLSGSAASGVMGGVAYGAGGYFLGSSANKIAGGNSENGDIGAGVGATVGLVFGPVGALVGGLLGGVIGGLFGPKPTDGTGGYRMNILTGMGETSGLNGDRYSQENRDAAKRMSDAINKVADSIETRAGLAGNLNYNYEVAVGNRDGLRGMFDGTEWKKYENTDEGAAKLIEDISLSMLRRAAEQADENVKKVILNSGSDANTILANLDFYNDVYRPIASPDAQPTSSYERSVLALNEHFEPIKAQATALGLALEPLTKAYEKQMSVLDEARIASFNATIQGMDLASMQLRGGNMLGPQLNAFDTQRNSDWNALALSILDQGFGEAQIGIAQQSFNTLRDLQRKSIVDQEAAARIANTNSLWDRFQAASGNGNTLEGAKWDYERRAQAEWMAAAADGITDLTLLAKVQAEERLQVERDYAERSAQIEEASMSKRLDALETLRSQSEILTTFLDRQAVSGPGVSSQQAFLAAQEQYLAALSSARNGGDLSAYTSAAQTLLDTNYAYNATGAQGTAVRDMVLSATRSLGATLDLPGFSTNLESGIDRIMSRVEATLEQRLTEIYEELRGQRLRAAA